MTMLDGRKLVTPMGAWLALLLSLLLTVASAGDARAEQPGLDGPGEAADTGAATADDALAGGNGGSGAAVETAPAVPLGCDGALCSTANGSGCNIGNGRTAPALTLFGLAILAAGLGGAHRRGRRRSEGGSPVPKESP